MGTTGEGKIDERVLRSVVRDGVVTSESVSRVLQSSVHEAADEANRAANVDYEYALDPRTQTRLQPSQLTDDAIVSINGTTLSVAQARAIGWLPAASGATQNPKADPPLREEDQTEDRPEEAELVTQAFADPAADEAFTEIVNATSGMEQMAAITDIVSTGEVSERVLNALASQAGVEPSELQSRFQPIMAQFEQQGREAVERSVPGLDSEAVFTWSREHAPKALQSAMTLHATHRQTGAYEGLTQCYLEQLADTDPDTALASKLPEGWSSRKDEQGRVMVTSPQQVEMSWRSAMQLRRRV